MHKKIAKTKAGGSISISGIQSDWSQISDRRQSKTAQELNVDDFIWINPAVIQIILQNNEYAFWYII